MKKISDTDLIKMGQGIFVPDAAVVRRCVRAELKLSKLIPKKSAAMFQVGQIPTMDWHGKTEERAWAEIISALDEMQKSGIRRAHVITGASGILKEKFANWCDVGVIAPRISSCKLINRGCYEITLKKPELNPD